MDKYKLIHDLRKQGKTQTQIAEELGVTQSAISWYMKQQTFKSLDKGEVDIETES